jgi:hypothetical protein
MRVGTILQFVGGRLGGVAISGIAIGIFFALFGVTPWQFVAGFLQQPPSWMMSPWVASSVVIIGICIIAVSLWFNVWSRKQKAIDELAEDLTFAINDLVNRKPRPQTDDDIQRWKKDYEAWCAKVSTKLENRAFFTRADQLHFDGLGFIEPLFMTGHPKFDELLSQLRLKFERLRDVINWTQQRRR